MAREALLLQTLVGLADSLVDDFDVVDLLTVLTDRCVEALDVAAAGVMLASPNGELRVVASSSEAMRALELFELQESEGPCVDCYRSGQPVVNIELAATETRWPAFTARARTDGFFSVHALPMRLRSQTIGALNIFRSDHDRLDAADMFAGQALADVATIAILQHRTIIDAKALNAQLGRALTSRVVIEQAKGKISEALGLDMERAFQRLRNHARRNNLRLSDLAQRISDGDMLPGALDPVEVRPPT